MESNNSLTHKSNIPLNGGAILIPILSTEMSKISKNNYMFVQLDFQNDLDIERAYKIRSYDHRVLLANKDLVCERMFAELENSYLSGEMSAGLFDEIQDSYLLPVFTSKRFSRKNGEFTRDERFAFEDIERLGKVKKLEDIAKAYGEDRCLFSQFVDQISDFGSEDVLDLDSKNLEYMGVELDVIDKLYRRSA